MSRDQTYKEYKKQTNMTFSELLRWSKNPLSRTASVNPKKESTEARRERRKLLRYLDPVLREKAKDFYTANIRNLVLLNTNKSDWDEFLVSQAQKSINYLKRAKKIKGKDLITNIRAMKNWAYDKKKKTN